MEKGELTYLLKLCTFTKMKVSLFSNKMTANLLLVKGAQLYVLYVLVNAFDFCHQTTTTPHPQTPSPNYHTCTLVKNTNIHSLHSDN